jgi:hypothetical protein
MHNLVTEAEKIPAIEQRHVSDRDIDMPATGTG